MRDKRGVTPCESVIKRILGTIPVLIGVVLLIFIMLRIVPGNAAAMLLGEHVDQATIDRLTEVMGLDKPVIVQFFDYLAGAIHGDLGISYKYNRAVTDMIIEAFPYTLELALLAALFAWVLGLGTGIIAAIRQNSLVDHLFMGVSLAGVSMPISWWRCCCNTCLPSKSRHSRLLWMVPSFP